MRMEEASAEEASERLDRLDRVGADGRHGQMGDACLLVGGDALGDVRLRPEDVGGRQQLSRDRRATASLRPGRYRSWISVASST
jgi:hypothetical protein